MYKLLNWVFGWDYVYWQNSADQGIARIRVTVDHKVYVYRYRITSLIDVIKDREQVLWLTCKAEKYGL